MGTQSLRVDPAVLARGKTKGATWWHKPQLAHPILVFLNSFLMQKRALLVKSAASWDYCLAHFAPSAISGDSEPNEASFST